MSCGEYGDNVSKLVNAIQNGKHDIRTGKPFPTMEPLNNAPANVNVNTGVDKKLGNGLNESTTSTGNGTNNLLLAYAKNDIAKETPACK